MLVRIAVYVMRVLVLVMASRLAKTNLRKICYHQKSFLHGQADATDHSKGKSVLPFSSFEIVAQCSDVRHMR